MASPMGHNRLASKSALASVRSDARFAGVFDKIVDFFTGKLNDKVEAAPAEEVPSEEQKRAEAKFEAEIRDIVDKSLSNLIEMNFSPDKIRALKGGGAVSKEFSDAVKKSGLNILNYTYEFYRYMIGHALQPSPTHFGISKEQASFQESLVKKKLGINEPIELDPGHLKRKREKAAPSRTRSYSDSGLRRIASRIAADEDELFGLDEEEFQGSEEEPNIEDDEGDDEGEESGGTVEVDFTAGPTEYSCRIELSMTATFEGLVSREVLTSKVQSELKASIEAGMKAVSNDLSLQSTEVKVLPIVMDCSVVDESDGGMDDFGMGSQVEQEDSEEEDSEDEDSEEENAEEEFDEEPEEEDFDYEDEQD